MPDRLKNNIQIAYDELNAGSKKYRCQLRRRPDSGGQSLRQQGFRRQQGQSGIGLCPEFILYDLAALHHEFHALKFSNVL